MAAPAFNELTISAIRPLANGIALSFVVPDELKSNYQFIPGQYLTLRSQIDGEDIRRSYSICSQHNDNTLEVGIKQVPDGRFSNFATTLKAGDQLQVMTPEGRFTADIGGRHNYLLIAAGSGITPCLSIAGSVLADEPDSHITLLYGNRNTAGIMFRDDLDALKNLYTERFMLTHILSAEKQDVENFNGRIDADKLKWFNDNQLINLNACDAVYLCGPHEMIESCTEALVSLGMEKQHIKFELFTTNTGQTEKRKPAPVRSAESDKKGTAVTIILDGAEHSIKVDSSKETVLDAAQKAGLDLPFSCAGGMCSTCRCKVASGETEMDLNFSLADWEVTARFTLACQTRPLSDNVVLDFDAT